LICTFNGSRELGRFSVLVCFAIIGTRFEIEIFAEIIVGKVVEVIEGANRAAACARDCARFKVSPGARWAPVGGLGATRRPPSACGR
jgi:hypothetical protein